MFNRIVVGSQCKMTYYTHRKMLVIFFFVIIEGGMLAVLFCTNCFKVVVILQFSQDFVWKDSLIVLFVKFIKQFCPKFPLPSLVQKLAQIYLLDLNWGVDFERFLSTCLPVADNG